MNLFNKLVHALVQFQGTKLKVVPGKQVSVSTSRGDRNISARAVTDQQLMSMLRDIVPEARRGDIVASGQTTFDYTAPSGRVRVVVDKHGNSYTIVATNLAGSGPAEALQRPKDGSLSGPGSSVEASAEQTATPKPHAHVLSSELPVIGHRFDDSGGRRIPSRVIKVEHKPNAIDRLFATMVEQGCSDLHLTSNNPPLYRKDGDIVTIDDAEPLTAKEIRELIWPITPEKNRAQFEEDSDTDFAYEIPEQARFRCNLFEDRHGPGAVFRIIPAEILTVRDLALSSHVIDLCRLPKGLVLVTGPTGSGKSTTLAAMIDYINANLQGHIITIEDPIEFVHPTKNCLVNQREVGIHTKSFKRALRAALREDPDVVLVGELRDLETMHIAIETAETGHLVFGTLHTNTAASAVDRIIDQFPADRQAQVRTMLSESLKGVIAQTLCKKKGGGRVAAYEVLIVGRSVANLIREGKTFQIPSIMQTGRAQGMTTLNQSLLALVQDGLVEPLEAYNKAVARPELRQAFTQANIPLALD